MNHQGILQNAEYAGVFQALADTTRRRIIVLLDERERCVNELVSHFRLSQPTISRHLSVLRQANLVVDTRDGRKVCYSLNREVLRFCSEYFDRFECCCNNRRYNKGSSQQHGARTSTAEDAPTSALITDQDDKGLFDSVGGEVKIS